MARNIDIYPRYDKLLVAMAQCYPQNIQVSESSAVVGLQAILDHTVERLLQVTEEVVSFLTNEQHKSFCLIFKWGLDGKSGHSRYKQATLDPSLDDSSMLMTSLVPLQLYCPPMNVASSSRASNKIIVWQNPRPGSTRFCRPLRIAFEKETAEKTKSEKERVSDEIKNLHATDAMGCTVTFDPHLTMLDGKACNAITYTKSTLRCYICQATISQFNNIDAMIVKTRWARPSAKPTFHQSV